MHFHRRGCEGVHGGLGTQIHHSGHADATDSAGPGQHGINALPGKKFAAIHLKIGRGPAQAPAESTARHYPATEAIRPLEKPFCLRQISGGQGPPDPAAAHPLTPFGEHR